MCGRFTLTTAPAVLAEHFQLAEPPSDLRPRYNVAPSQQVAAIRVLVQEQGRELHMLRWGLIPSWAKDPKIGYRMINARSETARTKPAFRAAYKRRRCLVLADGFYEWKRVGKSKKQPFHIRMRDGQPFGIAGLWEEWVNKDDGEVVQSCTLLTTEANELVAEVHDRMPVILQPKDYDLWLDPKMQDPEQLADLLCPLSADLLEARPVSARVNSPKNDDPACLEPEHASEQGLFPDEP